MEKMLIINGSPRAPKSNSKEYIKIFMKYRKYDIDIYNIVTEKNRDIPDNIDSYNRYMLVMPLYADSVPAIVTGFLKKLEKKKISEGKRVDVLINCGFMEPEQNLVAIDVIKMFCIRKNLEYGMTLSIASGEAILNTPFAFMARRRIKKFAKSLKRNEKGYMSVSMPISKNMFLKASTKYWTKYGEKYGISIEEMKTNNIENI